jgi:G3E family GTPase
MEIAGFVSQAGVLRDTRALGFFWSAVDEAEWPQEADTLAELKGLMKGPYGDRRTEIVLIGRDMDEAELSAKFDACLLTDAELDKGPNAWAKLADPFPQWVPGAAG